MELLQSIATRELQWRRGVVHKEGTVALLKKEGKKDCKERRKNDVSAS